MSAALLAQVLGDKKHRGTRRLLLLSLADGGGVVNVDSVMRWCNMTRSASEKLISQMIDEGWLSDVGGKIVHPGLYLAAHDDVVGGGGVRK